MSNGSEQAGREERPAAVLVWDRFVRFFHWMLVVLFTASWYSGGIWDTPHLAAGYGVLALILARIAWGFFGSRFARFSDFIYPARAVFGYTNDVLRLRAHRYLGHNPLGGLMVLALLGTLVVICVSGVMMTMDAFWGVAWVDTLHAGATNVALALVALHIGGVIFTSIEQRENLVRAMITGRKRPAL